MFKSILLLLLVGFKASTSAQSSSALDDFAAFENDGKIYLNWTLGAGSTCNGIQIQRSMDSLSFYQIGEIPGVCGSNSAAQRYTFVDSFPILNSNHYYRLELGGVGYSEVINVRVLGSTKELFSVFPVPVVDVFEVCDLNKSPLSKKLTIVDAYGNKYCTTEWQGECKQLDWSAAPSGLYFCLMELELSGLFVVRKLLKVSE